MQTRLKEDLEKLVFKTNEFNLPKIKDLYLFTLNHKTAPIPIREKVSIPEYRLAEANQNLKNYKSLKSFLILSTCNRTEIYFTTNNFENALSDLYDFLVKYFETEKKIINEYSNIIQENEVVDHAFKLASGLDSLVLGEKQILSQVKDAYSMAQKEKNLDKTLELLFQAVIKTGKEVHKNTNLSKNSQSISSVAIDLSNSIAGPLKTKSILVLGAGNMSKLALEHILKIGGSKETVVLNRSPHRVIEFPEKYKTDKSVPFENIYEVLNDIDILICAAGAPHFIIFAEQFKQIRKDINKPLFIFDISMPRNIDSEFGKLLNITLYDIDIIQHLSSQLPAPASKNEDLNQAKKIISHGTNKFYEQVANQDLDLLIKDLKEKFEKERLDKLSKLTSSKTSFTKEEVDYITKNLMNAVFHGPIKDLKKSNASGSQNKKVEILRDLFGL